MSLSVKGSGEGFIQDSGEILVQNGDKNAEDETAAFEVLEKHQQEKKNVKLRGGGGAFNTTKHLWAGAVSAMVSRFLALSLPLYMCV